MSNFLDTASVINVIGNAYNHPEIFSSEEKYFFLEEDFTDELHRVIFGTMYKLIELGARTLDLKTIEDFLSARPSKLAIYKSGKGAEFIMRAAESASLSTFDYYYNRMKKMTLLREFDKIGFNSKNIYDPDNILDVKKKQAQEDWLDNKTLSELADFVFEQIDEIKMKFVDDASGESEHIGNGLMDLKERLKQNPEVGLPLYGNLINTITRGARLKKFYLRSAPTGVGKAIPNNTIIPTPIGYRQVGDIKPGDYLFSQDGKPTKVTQIHPQSEKKQEFKVIFSDGREALCCGEHLWEYQYQSHREYLTRVESVSEILSRVNKLKNRFKNSDNRGYRFRIPVNESVQYKEKEYSIDPYVFGLLLGDGSFRYTSNNKALTFSSSSEELPKIISEICDWKYKKNSEFNYSYTFEYKNPEAHLNVWVTDILKDYPSLWNVLSQDKFIPEEYLLGSVEQRYKLLAGLLDTDGSIDKNGRVSFTNTSLNLINDVVELCHSLGFITTVSEDKRVDKYTNKCWNVHIQCKKELKSKLFNLSKKHEVAVNYENNGKRKEHKDYLAIVDIIPTDNYSDMTCFTVNNDKHLFLTNDFIVTHNTRSMVADACYLGCNEIYSSELGWIKTGASQPVLFITTEQELEEIQTLMLAFVANVDEDKILYGKYTKEEEDRLDRAIEILRNSPIYIEELPDFSLKDIENTIKRNVNKYNCTYVFDRKVNGLCNTFPAYHWGQLVA